MHPNAETVQSSPALVSVRAMLCRAGRAHKPFPGDAFFLSTVPHNLAHGRWELHTQGNQIAAIFVGSSATIDLSPQAFEVVMGLKGVSPRRVFAARGVFDMDLERYRDLIYGQTAINRRIVEILVLGARDRRSLSALPDRVPLPP